MEDINVGDRILHLREKNHLSQKQLAERINITPSMLSQIERNLANPSLSTLRMLSKELNIPLYYLFMHNDTEKELIVRKNDRKLIGSKDKTKPYLELLTPDTTGNIEFFQMTLQPNTSSAKDFLNHDSEEVAIVISGTIVLETETENYTLNEGDSVRLPHLIRHRWKNESEMDTKLIFALTPPNF